MSEILQSCISRKRKCLFNLFYFNLMFYWFCIELSSETWLTILNTKNLRLSLTINSDARHCCLYTLTYVMKLFFLRIARSIPVRATFCLLL